jgi:hypothetical protein
MKPDERARSRASEAVEFERYALALLRAEAVSQGRMLLAGNELPRDLSFTDALAPAGILEYSGPCFIFLVNRRQANKIQLITSRRTAAENQTADDPVTCRSVESHSICLNHKRIAWTARVARNPLHGPG